MTGRREKRLRKKAWSRRAPADSMVIQNPRSRFLDSIKKQVSLCENQLFCALPCVNSAAIDDRPHSLAVIIYNYITDP
jgi:hypothetical protein